MKAGLIFNGSESLEMTKVHICGGRTLLKCLLLCHLFGFCHASCECDTSQKHNYTTRKELITYLFQNYEKTYPPNLNEPTDLRVNIKIFFLYDISDKDSSFMVRYFLYWVWKDKRLCFEPFLEDGIKVDELKLSLEEYKEKSRSNCSHQQIT